MSDSVHIVCPDCNITNNVPDKRLTDNPLCGNCKNRLFAGQPLKLRGDSFYKHINNSDIPVMVDFWDDLCAPCKTMTPVIEKVSGMLEPRLRIAKLNSEDEEGIFARYNIRGVPTLIIFKKGKEAARISGAMDITALIRWIEQHL